MNDKLLEDLHDIELEDAADATEEMRALVEGVDLS